MSAFDQTTWSRMAVAHWPTLHGRLHKPAHMRLIPSDILGGQPQKILSEKVPQCVYLILIFTVAFVPMMGAKSTLSGSLILIGINWVTLA